LVVIFAAELPDKTMFATLVLGTRYAPRWVFVGAAGAFLVHVVIAVAVGQAFTLLPKAAVDGVVAALFVVGAAFLLFGSESAAEIEGTADAGSNADVGTSSTDPVALTTTGAPSPIRIVLTASSVVFLAEIGDLTQITTANLAARYKSPISVGIGAVLGLWAVAAIAITAGRNLVKVVPLVLVRRIAGFLMVALALVSIVEALRA
jgi:putative Ca2+/H+ antiporter (TMEM165/GDT1 family)